MARWDPEAALDAHRARARHVHGRAADVLRLDDAGAGFQHRTGREPAPHLERRRGRGRGVRRARPTRAFGARVKRTYGSTEVPTIITDGRTIGEVEVRDRRERRAARRAGPRCASATSTPRRPRTRSRADGWFRTGDLADDRRRRHDRDRRPHQGRHHPRRREHQHRRGRARARSASRRAPRGRRRRTRRAHGRAGRRVRRGRGRRSTSTRAGRGSRTQGVARFKTPERVVVVDALPLLPTGKPDRAALRARRYSQLEVSTPIILKPLITARGFSVPGFQWKLYMRSFATFCTNIFAWSRFTRMPRVAVCFS